MTGLLAVARREILQRKHVLTAAAAASLIPFAAPLFRGMPGGTAQQLRGEAALLLGFAFPAGIVTLLAGSLASAIASRQIAFDFARPLSAASLWGGRLAAALSLAIASAGIVILPATLAGPIVSGGSLFAVTGLPRWWPALALVVLLAAYGIGQTILLSRRSRSVWLLIDVALFALVLFGAGTVFSRLLALLADTPVRRVGIWLAASFLVAVLGAGFAAVSRGRTSLASAHRASSLWLWSILGVAVLSAHGYAWWVASARPADLAELWAVPAARGPWMQLGGSARGAHATFLYDSQSGRFSRASTIDWRGPVFSRDGRTAAWIPYAPREASRAVWIWRLDEASAKPALSRILLRTYPGLFVLSDDGSRLATFEEGTLSIHDVGTARLLASTRVPVGPRQEVRGLFPQPDRFRIYRWDASVIDIFELDITGRSLTKRGEVSGLTDLRYFVADAAGSRLVVTDGPDRRKRLFEGRTGALLATLSDTSSEARWPMFLADGRIIVSDHSAAGLRLLVFGKDGERLGALALPSGSGVALGGEMAAGKVVVGIADAGFHYASYLADLEAGSTRLLAEGLRPVLGLWATAELGSEATRIFYGPGQNALVRLDPLTGQRQTILGARP